MIFSEINCSKEFSDKLNHNFLFVFNCVTFFNARMIIVIVLIIILSFFLDIFFFMGETGDCE